MDALRNTINTQSIKTKQIVFQYPDGSFPEPGALLNVTDTRGHTDWTRAPNLDSITLVDASGNEGIITYTDASGLLVNNVPVGGGGGSVTGGTNIQVSGLDVVDFDPTKGGGVDMLGAPMTNATQISFTDSGKNATLLFDSSSTDGTLTLTNTTNTPQLSISAGAAASIQASAGTFTNTNTITMSTSGANGTSTIIMTDGTTNAAVSYTEVNDQLTISCSENLSLVADNIAHTIEMGSALGKVLVSTKDDPIALVRYDPLPSTAIQTVLKVDTVGVIQIGDDGVLTDPGLRFQGALNDATIQLDDATNVLNMTSVTNAPLQLNVPLNDGTGVAGVATQVLTSQGPGLPPIWAAAAAAAAGAGGGVVLASKTYTYTGSTQTAIINTTEFPGIPTSTPIRTRIYSRAGGGGGGGGAGFGAGNPYGGRMIGGGGGGGGAGYTQDYFFTVPYGTSFLLDIGNGGLGGSGADLLKGAPSVGTAGGNNTIQSTFGGKTFSLITPGGGGGIAGTAGIGGGGDTAGDTAPGNLTELGGANVTPGGNGGGFYGGLAGAGDGSVPITERKAGRGIAAPTATLLSGAGGGGGGGGAGSDGETGGDGTSGFIRIDIYA